MTTNDRWRVLSVDFVTTEEHQPERSWVIQYVVANFSEETHRPVTRSRIDFANGTCSFRYDVALIGGPQTEENVRQALLVEGIISSDDAVRMEI